MITSHILSEIEKVAHRAAILLNGHLLGVHVLGESATAPYLRLTIRSLASARVQACVLAVAGVVSITPQETHGEVTEYLVQVQHLHVAEPLTAALVAHGFGVLEIRAARLDLETLFLQLTRTEVPV